MRQRVVDHYKILFIMGMGRSGSTIASITLAQRSDVVNIGEIGNLWRDGFSENLLCGCGEKYAECSFWPSVVEEAYGSFDCVPLCEIQPAWRRTYHKSTIFRIASGTLSASQKEDLHLLQEALSRLYPAIVKVSGRRVVVDSSKRPLHAFLLNDLPASDLYLIHWVRDSRAVAFSSQRKKRRKEVLNEEKYLAQRTVWKASLLWDYTSFWAETTRLLKGPQIRMRYEDFVMNPLAEITRMTQFANISPPPPDFLEVDANNFVQSHSILGNPIRFSEKLEIRPDFEWQKSFPPWKKALTTTLTLPFLLRYGYLTNNPGPASS